MKTMLLTALLLTSTTVLADGFQCETESGLQVKVYNHTDAAVGTRTASVMVISDSFVQAGRKTIAKFSDVKGTLDSAGSSFEANVDLRFADSRRKGELLAGTKLGYVDRVLLTVDHNYLQPVAAGTELSGLLQIAKRDGSVIEESAVCVRYLKN